MDTANTSPDTSPRSVDQLSFADVGEDLSTITFVIVDLETTGGPATEAGITEIGAVKVRAGEVIGEFATLVRPPGSIPGHITALTGIDDTMVVDAPSVAGAVASFGEFAGDAVLVAHNAPYDLGFLKAACARFDLSWFPGRSLDTARLARVALLPGEVRNCKLATLARHFRAPVTPIHRALADAQATTHVLHCLLERVGSLGVRTWEDLRDFIGRVSPAQRAKRTLADGLPTGPGVYTFVDRQGAPLYIGTSANVRSRVRSYFTATENRARMSEMIAIAERVESIPCATALEAHVREIRIISDRRPHYNRRSRRAQDSWWLRISDKPRLRLVAVKSADGTPPANSWGPFTSRSAARHVADAISSMDADRFTDTPSAEHIREIVAGDLGGFQAAAAARMLDLANVERFEEAGRVRDALVAVCQASERHQRIQMLRRTERIVTAHPDTRGGWAIHVLSAGRLTAAAHARPGDDARATAAAAMSTAESGQLTGTTVEETVLLAKHLELDQVRLVDVSAPLSWPITSGSTMASLRVAHIREPSTTAMRPVGPAPGVTRVSRIAHSA